MASKKPTVPATKTKPKKGSWRVLPKSTTTDEIVDELMKASPEKKKTGRKPGIPGKPIITKDKKAVLEAVLPNKLESGVRSPKKKPPAEEKPEPEIHVESEPIGEGLTVRQELFCRNYVQNDHLRGNGTFCYAEAYGVDLASMPCDDFELDPVIEGKILKKSSYQRAYRVCNVRASQLLRSVKVNDRITQLWAEMLNPSLIDSRLAQIVKNGRDTDAVSAIREANRVLGRGSDTVKHEGIPNLPAVVQIQVIQPTNAGIDANPAG